MTAEAQHRVAGRYRLIEPIGRGGMGIVWRAHDDLLDRMVAVKEVLYRALSEEDRADFNRRTIREARAAGRLDHPSVVVVHDVIEEDGRPWIVMQLVRSRSLGEVLRTSGPLAPASVAEIGAQVLDALRAAHASGVLHRDVKPENVLLTDSGRVVLTDFGIATMPDETALTTTGNLSGTPAFMPPERLRGLPAVPESDLWSLGATLYAAVEGRPPFDMGAPVPTMAAVLSQSPEPTRLAGPLRPVIEGLLRKEPGLRLPAAEAAEALRRIASGQGTETRRERVPAPGRPAPARSRVMLVAGLVLAVAVAGVGGWFGYRRLTGTVAAGEPTPAVSSPAAITSSAAVPPVTSEASPTPGPSSRSPSAPTPPARPALPEGWRRHTDRLGFSLGVPAGWKTFGRQKARVYFGPPGSQTYLLVDTTPWGRDDPLAALRQVEAEAVAKDRLPGYQRVSLRAGTFRGRPAADWEFTWRLSKGRAHVIDRAFALEDGRQFAIYLHSTEDRWAEDYADFSRFVMSFRPS